MNLVDQITKSQIRTDLPEFRVGDTVKVNVRIIEGKRERIQAFEGIVMAIQGGGVSKLSLLEKFLVVLVLKEFSLLTHLKLTA